ncbi:MAG: SDR family NAD(P)-dependent oxidoreductase, partial [Bryobacteraceae bacterium]
LFLPAMIARRKGYVLNVASTAAFQPGPLMAVYYASKAYVVSFSSALHNELRPHGVLVTTLCPGPTQTEFQRRAQMEATRLFRGTAMNSTSVARIGFDAMMRGKPLVVAGRLNGLMAFLTRFAPRQMAASMARRMQEV